MRIVGGALKGRRFSPPGNFRARPTTDMAKENLFNILSNFIDFEETEVLDLFAGTGSISYEFASRGCKKVVSLEKDFHHYKFICKCIADLELDRIITPQKQDVFTYLRHNENDNFDLIFADPPFELKNLKDIPLLIMESNLLRNNGCFILEHGPDYDLSKEHGFSQVRHYGKVFFSFFEKKLF